MLTIIWRLVADLEEVGARHFVASHKCGKNCSDWYSAAQKIPCHTACWQMWASRQFRGWVLWDTERSIPTPNHNSLNCTHRHWTSTMTATYRAPTTTHFFWCHADGRATNYGTGHVYVLTVLTSPELRAFWELLSFIVFVQESARLSNRWRWRWRKFGFLVAGTIQPACPCLFILFLLSIFTLALYFAERTFLQMLTYEAYC